MLALLCCAWFILETALSLSTSILQVGQVCCRWNQERRQAMWNMWLQGSFLQRSAISSRQIIHTLLAVFSSSAVASGYLCVEGGGGGGGWGEVWIIDTVYNYIDLHVEIQSHVRLLTYGNYTYSVLRFLMALCEEITSAMLF